jgi:hypothetical protein
MAHGRAELCRGRIPRRVSRRRPRVLRQSATARVRLHRLTWRESSRDCIRRRSIHESVDRSGGKSSDQDRCRHTRAARARDISGEVRHTANRARRLRASARRARRLRCRLVRSEPAADHRSRTDVFHLPRWLSRRACWGHCFRRAGQYVRRRPDRCGEFSSDRLTGERPWPRRMGRLRREVEHNRRSIPLCHLHRRQRLRGTGGAGGGRRGKRICGRADQFIRFSDALRHSVLAAGSE